MLGKADEELALEKLASWHQRKQRMHTIADEQHVLSKVWRE